MEAAAAGAPCPHCLEAAPLTAASCPACGGDLHVDVLTAPLADDRARYRLARELAGTGWPWPAFAAVQAALKPPGGVLAHHVSRADAAQLVEGLAAHGLEGSTRPTHGPPPLPPPPPPPVRRSMVLPWWALVAGVTACLVVAALTIVQLRRWRVIGPAPMPYAELAERGRRATVVLTSGDCQGSGFFVSADLLLTNAHVLCGETVAAQIDGLPHDATIVRIDDELDLALVRAPGANATPLRLADATSLERGELVVAAGAPLGHEGTVARGTITRPFVTVWGVVHIEANATVSPGNSGGPLLNDRGEAVGVVSKLRTERDRRWALAIPVNYVSSWLPEGRSARGWAWELRVAEAARMVESDLQRFESARRRPMLLGAHYVQYATDPRHGGEYGMGQLVFVVAGPTAAQGGEPAQLTVRATCGDTRPKEAALSPWMSIDARPERSPQLDVQLLRPFAAWARKRSLGAAIVVGSGETWIPYPNRCRNSELILLDGDAVADRVPIE